MRSVLITGGSGYFGQAFVTRLLALRAGPERICVYSRGEHAQAAMREQIADDRVRYFIGDVRDSDRLELAMHGVDTVIHAAALKRIEVCEYSPMEAVATNVIGAQNVINAAIRSNVSRVVALSSDKACEPTTLYGSTKLTAERNFLASNIYARTQFACTRYGNVWGSTGSVVPRWREALALGRKPTVSDYVCTRFYMTIEEAVDLVLEAVAQMPKAVLIPELPAYQLSDLADAMGLPAATHTGLAAGEKLHERMVEGGPDSSQVRRMSVAELKEKLAYV